MGSGDRGAGDSGSAGTGPRAAAKAARREQLLRVAKTLFARHGFHGVRLEDLAKGAGISTPAVYRHFESKESVLEELLVGISKYLHSGGRAVIDGTESSADGPSGAGAPSKVSASSSETGGSSAADLLCRLIDFHVDFAMSEPELIRIQDRDFTALPETSRRTVRRLQRAYVSDWAHVVADLRPDWGSERATIRVHAAFGMMNSTPYLARSSDAELVAAELRTAARAALQA